jgi:uncharacterized membrane protein (DUF106 family)
MTGLVQALNRLLTGGFDLLFRPLSLLGPALSLLLFSVATGLLMVWIFGRVSDQAKIRRTRDRIQGNLIAVRLFQNSAGVFLRTQGRLFLDTLKYLGLSLKPMLVMIVPVLLILVQLNGRYGIRPLEVGESALVKVKVGQAGLLDGATPARLSAEEGVTVETPPIRIPSEGEIAWRVRALSEGRHVLTVRVGDRQVTKLVVAGGEPRFLSAARTGEGVAGMLLNPGEPPLDPSTGLESVSIGYPATILSIMGREVNWLIFFFVLSIAAGYLLKGVLGVEV